MIADYHTHNALCRHAEGEPADYVAAAKTAGLPEIGIADHSPMPETFDDWRMLREEFPRYLELVEEARLAHPDFPVRLGMEVDYFPPGAIGHDWISELKDMADWDYWIGSVHYIAPGWDVDNPKWIGRFSEGDVAEIWKTYWDIYVQAIKSEQFHIMGHADLPKKFGFRPEGDLRKYYEPAVAAAVEHGVAFEINTAGWYKECAEQYPSRAFLEMVYEAEVPIVISSDAHEPRHVGRDFEKAREIAIEVGFLTTLRFENGVRKTVNL